MSSSRSIAAARQRRAGEAPPVGQQRVPGTSINSQQAFAHHQQQTNSNQLPPKAPVVPVGKLAIGDAFALVTIRLGRIETIIQKLEAEGVIGPNAPHLSNTMEHDENMRLVDDTVIRNIIARLGDLEKGQSKLGKVDSSNNINVNEVNGIVEQKTANLQEQIVKLKDELRETKELLMKLQSFSMETNQKIISLVLTQEKQENMLKNVNVVPENKSESENKDETENDIHQHDDNNHDENGDENSDENGDVNGDENGDENGDVNGDDDMNDNDTGVEKENDSTTKK